MIIIIHCLSEYLTIKLRESVHKLFETETVFDGVYAEDITWNSQKVQVPCVVQGQKDIQQEDGIEIILDNFVDEVMVGELLLEFSKQINDTVFFVLGDPSGYINGVEVELI